MYIAIVGERSRKFTPEDLEFVKKLIKDSNNSGTVFVSIGCNAGVGRAVKEACGTCVKCGEPPSVYRPKYDTIRKKTVASNCPRGYDRDACESVEVVAPFAEMSVQFQGFYGAMAQRQHIGLYLARNEALTTIGDVFYVLTNESRTGMIEQIVSRLKSIQGSNKAFAIFNERNEVIEQFGFTPEGETV